MGVIIFDGFAQDKEEYTVRMAEKIIAHLKDEKPGDEDQDDFYIPDYEHN